MGQQKTTKMRRIDLCSLRDQGVHGNLTSTCGGFLSESASACFIENGHKVEFSLAVQGAVSETVSLRREKDSKMLRDTYNDLEDATHHGAYGVAIVLVRSLLGYSIVMRSKKGTGFDYWVRKASDEDSALVFTNSARLEVSGILKIKAGELERRTRDKLRQTRPSDNTGLTAIAAVIEFETPTAMIRMRAP